MKFTHRYYTRSIWHATCGAGDAHPWTLLQCTCKFTHTRGRGDSPIQPITMRPGRVHLSVALHASGERLAGSAYIETWAQAPATAAAVPPHSVSVTIFFITLVQLVHAACHKAAGGGSWAYDLLLRAS